MSRIDNLEIKVYPVILESPLVATHLWHLIRAIDKQGSGKVSFTLKELQEILGVSKSSIYRYLNSNLFEKVCKHTNKNKERVYTIYYKSLKLVKQLCGLENLITASFCYWFDIKSFMDKRRTATEIIAESIQARSYYNARNSKKEHQRFLDINTVFAEEKSSTFDNTQRVKQDEYGIYYDIKQYVPYGCSQKTVAKVLSRSRQTVNKRLKNKIKIQQFVKKDLTAINYERQRYFDSEEYTTIASAKYFNRHGYVYERYTNLYKPIFVLKHKVISFSSNPRQFNI